jgi:hypothetical protein
MSRHQSWFQLSRTGYRHECPAVQNHRYSALAQKWVIALFYDQFSSQNFNSNTDAYFPETDWLISIYATSKIIYSIEK